MDLSIPEIALLFTHMANLGYAIVAKENNPECTSCSEFTLLHVERRL